MSLSLSLSPSLSVSKRFATTTIFGLEGLPIVRTLNPKSLSLTVEGLSTNQYLLLGLRVSFQVVRFANPILPVRVLAPISF